MKSKNLYPIIFLLPLILFITAHYSSPFFNEKLTSSGFLTGEAPYYMANARQYLDFGFDSIFYSNPFSDDLNSKRHYFQFQTYILAVLLKLLPFSPGAIWNLFGLFFGFLFIKEAIKLIDSKIIENSQLPPLKYFFLLALFFFGGGVHVIAGIIHGLSQGDISLISILKSTDSLEIADGWWMHSVARNFLLPNYIFYYFLVFKILSHIDKNNSKSLFWQFVLAFSHPFVGVQTIFGICAWKVFEVFYFRSKLFSKKNLVINIGILMTLFFYYMIFLNLDPEHKQQESQWKTTYDHLYKNWAMLGKNFIPSYLLVFIFFFLNISPSKNFATFFKNPFYRFLAFLGVSNFFIANHEFIISPIQPIHFTQGMVWFPFALLSLVYFKDKINVKKISYPMIVLFTLFFTLDNTVWYAKRIFQEFKGQNQQTHRLTKEETSIIAFLKENFNDKKYLLVTANRQLSYHSSYQTSMSQWMAHKNITPRAYEKTLMLREFITDQTVNDHWKDRETIFVTGKKVKLPIQDEVQISLATKNYNVWRLL